MLRQAGDQMRLTDGGGFHDKAQFLGLDNAGMGYRQEYALHSTPDVN